MARVVIVKVAVVAGEVVADGSVDGAGSVQVRLPARVLELLTSPPERRRVLAIFLRAEHEKRGVNDAALVGELDV